MRALGLRIPFCFLTLLVITQAVQVRATAQTDAKYSFRTDSANQNLTWYQLKPGEFPPFHSEHRVGGELVEVDYIHRCGVFRKETESEGGKDDGKKGGKEVGGEMVNFSLLPFGSVSYLNAEADLRDVRLGTYFVFFLYQDASGAFTQVAMMQDAYSLAAGQGFAYRLDAVNGTSGKATRLLVTRHNTVKPEPDAAQEEILVDDNTRVWKGGKQVTLSDLVVGDDLLFNFTGGSLTGGSLTGGSRAGESLTGGSFTGGSSLTPRRCTEIWVGADTQKLATDQERRKYFALLKARGVPAWIDRVDGDKLTVTLFSGEPASTQALFKQEGIDPVQWAKEHRRVSLAVANEHLRTYLPNVTNKGASVLEFQSVPTDCYGCSGVRLVIQPELMLEGYRKGHMVRLFSPSWPVDAMPFGEGLYAGGHDEEPADSKELQSADFPYRTDFGNENLPWYQLQPGKAPPDHSEHRVGGELVKVGADHRSGQFRTEGGKVGTGEFVNFTLPPIGKVLYLNADATLQDMPLGMRCLFYLYQDEKGAFTRAAVVMDEFSYLAGNTLTYRLESAKLSDGKLVVARHAAPVKVDYVLEPRVPSDSGRLELEVDADTRVWKGDHQVKLTDLAVGDELLVNRSARTTTSTGRCSDIWVGPETARIATEEQRKRHAAFLK